MSNISTGINATSGTIKFKNTGKTMHLTCMIRRYYPHGLTGPFILQQAWECIEDKSLEWRPVPSVDGSVES